MRPLDLLEAGGLDTVHVVHGVDQAGAYLGLVSRAQAAQVANGAPPASGWRWQAGRWRPPLPTLADLRAQRWEAVKRARTLAMRGTFTHAGLVYDIDPVNITGAAVLAMRAQAAGAPFSQQWVLADNSTTTLDAAAMCAVGEACAQAVSSLWATSTALRAQIQAATTLQALAAIQWPDQTP